MLTGSVASDEVLEARLLELLLHEMSRYPGVVILCCSSYDAYDAVVHTIAPTLLAAMRRLLTPTLSQNPIPKPYPYP